MAETSRFWTGTTVGDAVDAPYDAPNEFSNVLKSLGGAGGSSRDRSGIFMGELDNFTPSGSVTPITIGSGRALVYGTWYENSVPLTVAVPTPGGATRLDYIVLRKDWTAQTVRITRIAGAEGGGLPALVQTPGDRWDQVIASISVTTGGAITITDRRSFIGTEQVKPFCTVYRTNAQSMLNTLYTDIIWEAVEYEPAEWSAMFDAGQPTRLTAPLPGIYSIETDIAWVANATGVRELNIAYYNAAGVAQANVQAIVPIVAAAGALTQYKKLEIAMNANEFFVSSGFQNSGGALDIFGGQYAVRSTLKWVRSRY